MHFADAIDVASCGIVCELVPVDLVKTVMRLAVDDDVDILQVCMTTLLELNGIGGADGVNRKSSFLSEEREAEGSILEVA